MRDSFGGVFTLNLFLVFIFIYVAFTAVSLNYARAFKVKNAVIDYIEQNEITNLDEYFGTTLPLKDKTKLDQTLGSLGYYKVCDSTTTPTSNGYCYGGVTITKIKEEAIQGTTTKTIYYQITTYADWNLGALNKLLALAGKREDSDTIVNGTWAINGEAKVVAKN